MLIFLLTPGLVTLIPEGIFEVFAELLQILGFGIPNGLLTNLPGAFDHPAVSEWCGMLVSFEPLLECLLFALDCNRRHVVSRMIILPYEVIVRVKLGNLWLDIIHEVALVRLIHLFLLPFFPYELIQLLWNRFSGTLKNLQVDWPPVADASCKHHPRTLSKFLLPFVGHLIWDVLTTTFLWSVDHVAAWVLIALESYLTRFVSVYQLLEVDVDP